MRTVGSRPFLLVEGGRLDDGPLSPAAVRGALLAVVDLGIVVLRSESYLDSALWITRAALRASGTRRSSDRPIYAQRPKAAGPRTAAEAALASIPTVSSGCAKALLEQFGSVAGVAAAELERLTAVPGIGPVRAALIAETLNGSHSAYRSRRSRERPGRAT